MSSEWHYAKDGARLGPVSAQRLKELAASGELAPADLVWKEGHPEWKPASTLKGLFPDVPVRPAGPPPLPAASPAGASPPPLPAAPPPPQVVGTAGVQPPRQPDFFDKARGLADKAKAKVGAIQKGAQEKFAASATQPTVSESGLTPVVDDFAPVVPPSAGSGKIDIQRLCMAVSAGLGMLATFLPWVTLPIVGSISGTAGDGWITLLLFVPALVLTLRGDRSTKLLGNARLGAVIPAGFAALMGLYKIVSFNSHMANAGAFAATVQIGIGLYLLIAAGVAVAVSAWVLEKSRGR